MTETEQKHSFELPALYKEILSSFDLYCLYQYKGKDLDIKNCNLLFEKLSRDYQAWQLLQYLDEPNTENTFVFGSQVMTPDYASTSPIGQFGTIGLTINLLTNS